ncbi:peptide chain release factor N(5)-glutamine methyltransferase [Rodentibacter caecimuris]|uniref:Release factor glutamine methyltransferase n=1 Tax=Rodentibacter caecimuris TaxID=1796644 RepID=A0ABX3KWR9_9PAST|nr:protein-(glutamine-N5) methyltransferase, release factor-specific [Rodentibacter heylii]
MNYKQWLDSSAMLLIKKLHHNNPYVDVKQETKQLLQSVIGKSTAHILAFSETELTQNELIQLDKKLQRRAKGEPIAYILGEKSFWSLDLSVSSDTLIPRPDTEILVEIALEKAKSRLNSTYFFPSFDGELAILDLGTGTGAIALSLAVELQPLIEKSGGKLTILGVDKIEGAVELAKINAKRNQVLNAQFLQSNWFDHLPSQKFDLIVANPPYIDPLDEHLQLGDVRFEPLSALIAEEQGYADLRLIIEQAKNYLKPQGWLIVEHGWQQGEKVRSIFQKNLWQKIETFCDYGNNERVTLGCRKE